jgi:hypothetical protein
LLSASARLGLGRLVGLFSYGRLPPESRDEARASMATVSQVGSTVDGYAEATSSMDEARSLRDFDAKPLIVLTAGRGHDAESLSGQDDMPRCRPTEFMVLWLRPPTHR